MIKHTLKHTCTLRPATQNENFLGNMLLLLLRSGTYLWEFDVLLLRHKSMMILQTDTNILLFSVKSNIPNEPFSSIPQTFPKNSGRVIWKERLVIPYQIRWWDSPLAFWKLVAATTSLKVTLRCHSKQTVKKY